MVAWITVIHQVGGAAAAYLGGVLRIGFGTYLEAFVISGLMCIGAALMVLFIGAGDRARAARAAAGAAAGRVVTASAPVRGGESKRRRQSRADHRLDHAGDDHAGRRQHDRQCRAAAYAGQPVGDAGPDRLGADLLHGLDGDHDAADRVARRTVRHQVRFPGLGARLHGVFRAGRQRDQPDAARDLPHRAGDLRRRAGAAVAIDAAVDQPAGTARAGDGGVGHGGHARADHGTGGRRLADRKLRLALDFLHQPAGRPDRRDRHSAVHPVQPAEPARAVRFLRVS